MLIVHALSICARLHLSLNAGESAEYILLNLKLDNRGMEWADLVNLTKNKSENKNKKEEVFVAAKAEKIHNSDETIILKSKIESQSTFSASKEIRQHSKALTSIAFEAGGARMLTASHDCTLAYWEFGNMKLGGDMKPFRLIEPIQGYGLRAVRISRDNQWVLVAGMAPRARLLDRNGSQVREYCSGDPYLMDLRRTDGHVSALTSVGWSPNDADRFGTSGEDGTVRIWNIGYRKRQEVVINVRGSGRRCPVGNFVFDSDGRNLVTGSADGIVRVWPINQPNALRAAISLQDDNNASAISCLQWSPVNQDLLATRTVTGGMRLWDRRAPQRPLMVYEGGAIAGEEDLLETSLSFSSDGNVLVTGAQQGSLHFVDAVNGETLATKSVADRPIVSVVWQHRLNQIAVGCGDGRLSLLYDPLQSQGGALLLADDQHHHHCCHRTFTVTEASLGGPTVPSIILTPYSGEPGSSGLMAPTSRKAKLRAQRKDPTASHLPAPPPPSQTAQGGRGKGGAIGSSLTQSYMRDLITPEQTSSRDQDPREALLRYAEIAEKEPLFVTPAYKQTQPTTIFDAQLLEREAAEERRKAEEAAAKRTKTH